LELRALIGRALLHTAQLVLPHLHRAVLDRQLLLLLSQLLAQRICLRLRPLQRADRRRRVPQLRLRLR
jgi:hypothetical protein